MRDLTAKTNIQKITDAIGGQIVELHYRLPTTEERFAFAKACLVQEGDEVKHDANPARLKFGLLVLTGFGEDDFGSNGQPISADPQSPNYIETWKDQLEESASDLIMALGMAVFEGARLLGPGTIKKAEDEEGGEGPLGNNSGD